MEAPGPSYQYTPLAPDGSTFRVLYICPGTEQDPIECELLEVPASSTPAYSALSYTWGEPAVTSQIWIRGQAIGIRENLAHALVRLRDASRIRSFWIDALCINQEDEAEKGTQIPLMRRIYQHSRLVTIFLGLDADASEHVPALCEQVLSVPETTHAKFLQETLRTGENLSPVWYERLGLPTPDDPRWDALRHFICRPWFTRLWTIQEIVLARSAEVVCGWWTMPWTRLTFTIQTALIIGLPCTPVDGPASYHTMDILIWVLSIGAGREGFTQTKCIDLLHRLRSASASEPHDYCYGLLGISKELHSPGLEIDYSIPVERVYCDFARFFISQGHGIRVLYNAAGHNLDLPSWVPDWTYRHFHKLRICTPPYEHEIAITSCAAASSFPPSISLHPTCPNMLIVRGLVFDRVVVLGKRYHSPYIPDENRDELVDKVRRTRHQDVTTILYSDQAQMANRARFYLVLSTQLVAECVNELSMLLSSSPFPVYPSGEDRNTVTWKTLICNRIVNQPTLATPDYVTYFQAFLVQRMRMCPSDVAWETLTTEQAPGLLLKGALEIGEKSHLYLRGATDFCYSRRRCRTELGYVGHVPLETRIGDLVFLPLGSRVPFIIRPEDTEKGTYKLIGECYVHGIMHGEAFRDEAETSEIHFV